ncbi:hypothetical protein EYC59_04065 [Candidatus Saccharibacteria bacterium]|nr:MAG: hypothetical protein EYC59_04065 [Candidatus Saccharibacteria bacterium]
MNISAWVLVVGIVGLLVVVFGAGLLARRRPRNLNKQYYQDRWQALQKMLKNKETWPLAIIDADKLLDDALRRSRYKGKTMGERLVSAQRTIADNDAVWFGHKLRNRLVHESDVKLVEKEVKQALLGIRAALKDLGAL